MNPDETMCKRKERRFKTCDERLLLCNVFVDVDDPVPGSVIDISPQGLRLLCSAEFRVGKAFLVELKTDRLHGVFPGVIRRVTPWVGGESVLGCQLLEPIPDEILQTLAKERVVNRRREDRVQWSKKATLRWELESEVVDAEIIDCSPGGLKIFSTKHIKDNTCVRLTLDTDDKKGVIIDAKTVWNTKSKNTDGVDGWFLGVTFIRNGVPDAVVKVLEKNEIREPVEVDDSVLHPAALVAAAVATFAIALVLLL